MPTATLELTSEYVDAAYDIPVEFYGKVGRAHANKKVLPTQHHD